MGVAACILAALAAPSPDLAAQEAEEILAYHVVVEVHDGGRMVVTEEIRVRVLGQEIRRGIYRDFPTDFPRASGLGRIQAPFEVLAVDRNGRPEPWSQESIGGPGGRGGVRVRIGDPDVLLEHGEHTFVLRYETWRWVGFGEDADQLYWNVTGNGWAFPIREATARVTLPRPPDPARVALEAWTGPEGSTASDAEVGWDAEGGAALFRTRSTLEPGSGLTVRVGFPKGVVAPPSPEVEAAWFRLDWGGFIDAATVAGLVLALYLLMWSRVGRDPAPGPLVVRYEPPAGYSPAALGFLQRRGYAPSLLAATLVSLGVKGALRIEEEKRKWTLERVGPRSRDGGDRDPDHGAGGTGRAPEPLAPEEGALLGSLLGSRSRLALVPTNAKVVQRGIKALKSSLSRRFEREHFVLNRRWFTAGLALSVAGFSVLAWRDRYGIPPEAWFFGVWLTFWSLGVGTLAFRAFQAWREALGGGGPGAWVGAVLITLFATPFFAAEILVLGLLVTRVPQHLLLAAVALGLVNVLFYHLLERPTLRGRGVLDALDGFKAFLSATDADRLDRMLAPRRTPELFERYLPHAIALGVENRWARAFEGVLAAGAAGAAASTSGALAWYAGGATADPGRIASSLGGAFSSSLSSASTPPSSGGGGGGGGGSSGGGGGGGGGGGW